MINDGSNGVVVDVTCEKARQGKPEEAGESLYALRLFLNIKKQQVNALCG